jgi:hypothetical protein
MGIVSKIGPGTEGGKLILEDFQNWRKTGFKPWVKRGLGGVNHHQSRVIYKTVSLNAFRSQARKIADIALEQMPTEDIEDEGEEDNGFKDNEEDNEDDENLPNDSENRNPWHRTEYAEEESDDDEDEDFEGDDISQEEDDNLEEFEDIAMTELIDSRSTLVIEYPNGKK